MFNFRRNSIPTQPAITADETQPKEKFLDTTIGAWTLAIGLGVAVGAVMVILNKGVENADVI